MHAKSFLSFLFLVGSLTGVTRAIAAEDPSPPSVTSHEVISSLTAVALCLITKAVPGSTEIG